MRFPGFVLAAFVPLIAVIPVAQQQQLPLRTLTPEIRIASSDSLPQAELSAIADLVVAPDGYIFVLDLVGGCPHGCIRMYNPNGRFERSFGRLGAGPGELRGDMFFGGAIGDTVLIINRGGSVQRYRRDGQHLSDERLPQIPGRAVRAYLPTGLTLLEHDYGPMPSMTRDSTIFRVRDTADRVVATLARSDGKSVWALGVSGLGILKQPFLAWPIVARGPGGTQALVVVPDSGWGWRGGEPGQVQIKILGSAGVQTQRVVSIGARRLTNSHRDSVIMHLVEANSERFIRPAANAPPAREVRTKALLEQRIRDQIVASDYLPAVEDAKLGHDGTVWLKVHSVNEWRVVSPSGTVVARVAVPEAVRVFQVSADRLWGVTRDADDLPIIIRYRVGGW